MVDNQDDHFIVRHAEIASDEWQKHDYDIRYLWHVDRLKRLRETIKRFDQEQIKESAQLYTAPQEKLVKQLENYSLSHQERFAISQYLAQLGDSRPGVGLRQDGLPEINGWISKEVKSGFGESNKFSLLSLFALQNTPSLTCSSKRL